MKPTEVSIKYARKINLGNYSTMDLECNITSSLEEGESVREVSKDLFLMAREAVAIQAKEIMEKKNGS